MNGRQLREEYLRRCAARGVVGHWFEPSTMRFFRSRLSEASIMLRGERILFCTSEQGPNGVRAYSVRAMGADGDIDTVGAFQGHRTLASAKRAMISAAGG